MDKKGKGKKVKKPAKKVEQKFGLLVNLDQQEPDIPVDKVLNKQEQQFKVIFTQQFKQQRPEERSQDNQAQIKSQMQQVDSVEQSKMRPTGSLITCERKEQSKKQQNQIKQQYTAIQPSQNQVKPQSNLFQEAQRIDQDISQNHLQYQQKRRTEIQIGKRNEQKGQIEGHKEKQQKIEAKQVQKAFSLKSEAIRQLQQDIEQKISIENKVVKKESSKLAGNKKKQSKQKNKMSITAQLNLQIEQFEEKNQVLPEKPQSIIYEKDSQQVQIQTRNIQAQYAEEKIESFIEKKSEKQQKQGLKMPTSQFQTKQLKNDILVNNYSPSVEKQINQTNSRQVIEGNSQNKSNIAQVKLQIEEDFEPKIIDSASKLVKKVKKSKTVRKQVKNDLKLSLQAQNFMIDQIKEEKLQAQPHRNVYQKIVSQQKEPLKVQNQMIQIQEKKPQSQQISQIVQDDLNQIQQNSNVRQQTIKQQVINDFRAINQAPVVQQQVRIISQANQPKENSFKSPAIQQNIEIQFSDMQVKVSKVKNAKKQAKKETKNKSSVKVQRELKISAQLQQIQVQSISVVAEKPATVPNAYKQEQFISDKVFDAQAKSQMQQQLYKPAYKSELITNKNQSQQSFEVKQRLVQPVAQQSAQVPTLIKQQLRVCIIQQFKETNQEVIHINEQIFNKVSVDHIQQHVFDHKQRQPQNFSIQPEKKLDAKEQNIVFDQLTDLEKGKMQTNKKVSKKGKGKIKPKSNALNMAELIMQVQQKSMEMQKTERVLQPQEKEDKNQHNLKQLKNIEQGKVQQMKKERTDLQFKSAQAHTNNEKLLIDAAEQAERLKQLAFYKKLQEEQRLYNYKQLSPSSQFQHQETAAQVKQTTSQLFNNAQEKLSIETKEQLLPESNKALLENMRTQEQQITKLAQKKIEPVLIDFQEQDASKKIALLQVSKTKPKNMKKPSKKVKTTISANILDLAEQNAQIKLQIQNYKHPIETHKKVEQKIVQSKAQILQPISKMQIQPNQPKKLLIKREERDPFSRIQQREIDNIQADSKQNQKITVQPQKSKRLQVEPTSNKRPPILQSVQKPQSQDKKTGSIVAQLIDLIRFKGDQDRRIARERLNMLQQDVRSRLLRKGRKNIAATRKSEGAQLYGSIIDENINLRQELKTIGQLT